MTSFVIKQQIIKKIEALLIRFGDLAIFSCLLFMFGWSAFAVRVAKLSLTLLEKFRAPSG